MGYLQRLRRHCLTQLAQQLRVESERALSPIEKADLFSAATLVEAAIRTLEEEVK